MPKGARSLSDLLEQRQEWRREVGQTVSVLRRASGQSQKEFAASLDISQPYLSQIESGSRTPSDETLRKLQNEFEGEADGQDSK